MKCECEFCGEPATHDIGMGLYFCCLPCLNANIPREVDPSIPVGTTVYWLKDTLKTYPLNPTSSPPQS